MSYLNTGGTLLFAACLSMSWQEGNGLAPQSSVINSSPISHHSRAALSEQTSGLMRRASNRRYASSAEPASADPTSAEPSRNGSGDPLISSKGDPRGALVEGPPLEVGTLIGVDLETFDQLFDPLDLASDAAALYRRRTVELKHGRVAMLAVVGLLVQEVVQLPGYVSLTSNLKFSDVPSGLGALTVLPPLGWLQLVLFVGFLELGPMRQTADRAPGDVASPALNWKRYDDPAVRDTKLLIELKNGRLAMLGVMGMLVSEAITGQTIGMQVASGNTNPFL